MNRMRAARHVVRVGVSSGWAAARVVRQIDVEPRDADFVLGQSLAEGRQTVEEQVFRCGRFRFESRDHFAAAKRDLEGQRANDGGLSRRRT